MARQALTWGLFSMLILVSIGNVVRSWTDMKEPAVEEPLDAQVLDLKYAKSIGDEGNVLHEGDAIKVTMDKPYEIVFTESKAAAIDVDGKRLRILLPGNGIVFSRDAESLYIRAESDTYRPTVQLQWDAEENARNVTFVVAGTPREGMFWLIKDELKDNELHLGQLQ